MIQKLKECLCEINGALQSVVFCGVLNMPGTSSETGENSLASRDDKAAAEVMMQLQSDYFMTEIVKQPTRGNRY